MPVQMFNPHAPLDLFCFVFSFSPVFAASSPVYLNAWNGLFGYDSVNNMKLFASLPIDAKVKNLPNDLMLYFEWVHKTFPSNITRYVYRLASTKIKKKQKQNKKNSIIPSKLSHSSSFLRPPL